MKFFRVQVATLCLAYPLAAQLRDIGPPPGKLVDIGGRKLQAIRDKKQLKPR